jgi:hypothetical protein
MFNNTYHLLDFIRVYNFVKEIHEEILMTDENKIRTSGLNVQTIRRNKNIFFALLIVVFICILLLFILSYRNINRVPDFIFEISFLLLLFLLFFSGIIYGFVTKDKLKASILGLLFSSLAGIHFAITRIFFIDYGPSGLNYSYLRFFAFLSYVLMGLFVAAASYFASTDTINRRKKLRCYILTIISIGIALFLFVFPLIAWIYIFSFDFR